MMTFSPNDTVAVIKAVTKKNLIYCGNCEKNGKREVLGEMDEGGNFIVVRFHRGNTIILGKSFSIKCGVCGNIAFSRNNRHDVINFRS